MRRALLLVVLSLIYALPARAAEQTFTIRFTPLGADPQIAIWLETATGTFIETIMVTNAVGRFGLGNRPGRRDFASGYRWPIGRREMALPVWAHRRGVLYDRIVFQDCREDDLGWHERHASNEPFYCRWTTPRELEVDPFLCPETVVLTDKGIAQRELVDDTDDCSRLRGSSSMTSVYPPRRDLTQLTSRDWSGARDWARSNDLDAVSKATPRTDHEATVEYSARDWLTPGDYVVWLEINSEYDFNEAHRYEPFIDPMLRDYGIPSLGQPSVVFKVPIAIGSGDTVALARDYAGYGSTSGEDGQLRVPDKTITTDMPGSGAGRLRSTRAQEGDFRVIVELHDTSLSLDAGIAPDASETATVDAGTFDAMPEPAALPAAFPRQRGSESGCRTTGEPRSASDLFAMLLVVVAAAALRQSR